MLDQQAATGKGGGNPPPARPRERALQGRKEGVLDSLFGCVDTARMDVVFGWLRG
jgi:hypothetical protein